MGSYVTSQPKGLSVERKIGDVHEILTFARWDEAEVLRDLVRYFCLWESIHKVGVINSGVKSLVQ